jgi:hypothetical protein
MNPLIHSIDLPITSCARCFWAMTICEKCSKHQEYHTCSVCNQQLCIDCFNTVHFGINAPRAGKSIIYNKCIFCGDIYGDNAKVDVCDKDTIILTWVSGMNYLAAVNRLSELIKSDKLDSKLRNENYCKTKFGVHATQVIMDAIDSSRLQT